MIIERYEDCRYEIWAKTGEKERKLYVSNVVKIEGAGNQRAERNAWSYYRALCGNTIWSKSHTELQNVLYSKMSLVKVIGTRMMENFEEYHRVVIGEDYVFTRNLLRNERALAIGKGTAHKI